MSRSCEAPKAALPLSYAADGAAVNLLLYVPRLRHVSYGAPLRKRDDQRYQNITLNDFPKSCNQDILTSMKYVNIMNF